MEPSVRILLAENVKTLRHQRGLSQDELAAKAGIHRTRLGTVERSEQSISVDSLEKLATALGVKPARLLQE
jgi:transcriptional regulator with XRE-family HTH domain